MGHASPQGDDCKAEERTGLLWAGIGVPHGSVQEQDLVDHLAGAKT